MARAGRIDRWLCALFDWLSGLPAAEAAGLRAEIMGTVMLQPATLLLASLGIALTSATAVAYTGRGWAIAWFVTDVVLLAIRMVPTIRAHRLGRPVPLPVARRIVSVATVVFVVFGLGCATAFWSGPEPLRVAVTGAVMGLIAGIATRWAALPRLAAATIATCSLPLCVAIAAQGAAAAALFAVVATGTALLTLQNQRTLLAMLRAERTASKLATTDALTALPNRAGLSAHLARLEHDAQGGDARLAILFLDLDGFKAVNDTFGHAAGDRALAETAARLRTAAAPHFACRLGGDEFVVAVAGPAAAAADALAARIRELVERPIVTADGLTLRLGASLGIASGLIDEDGAAALLHRADIVLYERRGARPAERLRRRA